MTPERLKEIVVEHERSRSFVLDPNDALKAWFHRGELVEAVTSIRSELAEARRSADEAWEHADELMEMCENDIPDEDERRDAQRAKDWARGADFALHYVGGLNLLEDVTRYNPFLNPLEG